MAKNKRACGNDNIPSSPLLQRSRRSNAKYSSVAEPAQRTRTPNAADTNPPPTGTGLPQPELTDELSCSRRPSTSLAFPRLPLELLQRIVELAVGTDVASLSARRKLNRLRLVNKATFLVASRVAHSHVFIPNASSARHVLDAIVLDTKKRPGEDINSKTSFYAPDIRALTIEHKPVVFGARSPVTTVLLRLPTALRRLQNLKSFAWRTTERPTSDIIRALVQLPSLDSLEIRDHQVVNPKIGMSYEKYTRAPLFPSISSLNGLSHLTLQLWLDEDGQFGGSAKWRDFCKNTLSHFDLLQSLVVEIKGTYNAEAAALCQLSWPQLRRLALNGINWLSPSLEVFPAFLARHRLLEELDIHDRIRSKETCIWSLIAGRIEHDQRILPNLQRISLGAATGARFVLTLLLTGFRDLRSVVLSRDRLVDAHYMELAAADAAHVSMRCESVEMLGISVVGVQELSACADKFPSLRYLDVTNAWGMEWDDISKHADELNFPHLEFLRLKFTDPRRSALPNGVFADPAEERDMLHSRAVQFVQRFPKLRLLQFDWVAGDFSNEHHSVRLSWDASRVDGDAVVLVDLEVEEIDCKHEAGRPVSWPTFSTLL